MLAKKLLRALYAAAKESNAVSRGLQAACACCKSNHAQCMFSCIVLWPTPMLQHPGPACSEVSYTLDAGHCG